MGQGALQLLQLENCEHLNALMSIHVPSCIHCDAPPIHQKISGVALQHPRATHRQYTGGLCLVQMTHMH